MNNKLWGKPNAKFRENNYPTVLVALKKMKFYSICRGPY